MIAILNTSHDFKYPVYNACGLKKDETYSVELLETKGLWVDFDDNRKQKVNAKEVIFDFYLQSIAYKGRVSIRKPAYHWILSYHPDDHPTREQILEDARCFLEGVGFTDTQYLITLHSKPNDFHVHIVSNIVNNQRLRISSQNLIRKTHTACAQITRNRNYTWGRSLKQELKDS